MRFSSLSETHKTALIETQSYTLYRWHHNGAVQYRSGMITHLARSYLNVAKW